MSEEIGIVRMGRIGAYLPNKGYGFIYEQTTRFQSWFFHIRACTFEPRIGLQVKFRIAPGPRGLMAIDVELLEDSGLEALAGKGGAL